MFSGLIFYAIGIAILINANMGLSPWDALHIGLSYQLGMTFGQISIILGSVILVINYFLKEAIGLGTICNMVGVGLMIDLIGWLGLIPQANNNIYGILMIVIGMLCIGFGSYWYVGSGFGAGPRDGLLIALSRTTNLSLGIIGVIIDGLALAIGYLLGAPIGIGTLIIGLGLGPTIQLVYRLFNFDANEVKHRFIISGSDGEDNTEMNGNYNEV
jgi:uncharacterized membrane protein YczE